MKKYLQAHTARIALYLVLLAGLFILPELSRAQYKWVLNGITTLRAGVSYFSSDLLKEESRNANHYVKGWDGKNKLSIPFNIRNYENTLLYNPVGQELKFEVGYELVTLRKNGNGELEEDKSNTKCTAELLKKDNPVTGTIFTITSTNTEPASDVRFAVEVTPHKDAPLRPGDQIVVTVWATRLTNATNHEFAGTLKSVFRYEVSDGSSFVQEFSPSCASQNSRRFVVTLGTGDVPNITGKAQNIVVWWDTGTIGTTTVGNYVFNDILSSQRNVTEETLKDYRKNYYTRTVGNETHSYSMLRLRDIGSGGNREIAFEWTGDLPDGYHTLYDLMAAMPTMQTNPYVAPLTDPNENNDNRDEASKPLSDDQITAGAVIGYYIESLKNDS